MNGSRLIVEGERALALNLRKLAKHVDAKHVVRPIMARAGGHMAEAALGLLHARSAGQPSHGARRHLQDSIRVSVVKERDRQSGTSGYQARIGPPPDNWYATFLEHGFTDRSGQAHPPRPFLRPAFTRLADTEARNIIRDLWTATETYARRHFRDRGGPTA